MTTTEERRTVSHPVSHPSSLHHQLESSYLPLSVDRTRADRPSLSFELYGVSPDYPQLKAHFICKPRPPLKDRDSFGPVRILGVALVIDPPFRDVSPDKVAERTIDLTAVRKEIDELCAVRVVVIALADYAALRALVEKHKSLTEPLSDKRTYLLACRRSEKYPFLDVNGGDGRLNRTWVGIDPVTLKATGSLFRCPGSGSVH